MDLMLSGKIGDAAKKINNEDTIKGVHQLSNEIKEILQNKHPKGKEAISQLIPHPIIPEQSPLYMKKSHQIWYIE